LFYLASNKDLLALVLDFSRPNRVLINETMVHAAGSG
jgi:hypothetical protein